MRFIGTVLGTGIALWICAMVLPGMHLDMGSGSLTDSLIIIGSISVIVALVNVIVRPVVSTLAAPITFLTLGLFQIVINTLMLRLASWVAGHFGLTLTFDSFWWALIAGIVVGGFGGAFGARGRATPRRRRSAEE